MWLNGAFAWCVTAVMRSDRFDCQWRTAPEMSRRRRRRRRTLDLFQNVDARGVGRWWGRRVVATAVATMYSLFSARKRSCPSLCTCKGYNASTLLSISGRRDPYWWQTRGTFFFFPFNLLFVPYRNVRETGTSR